MESKLVTRLLQIEDEYKKLFCTTENQEFGIRFKDGKIHDMYYHNYTYINTPLDKKELYRIIEAEIAFSKAQNKTFCQVEFDAVFDDYQGLSMTPDITINDYMILDLSKETEFRYNEEVVIKHANTNMINQEGIDIDVAINGPFMEFEWARKRMNRKSLVYQDKNTKLDFFVVYYNDKAIGKCEYFVSDDIVKIEDFDIHEDYRGKGVGSAMVRHFIDKAKEDQMKYIYLITDSEDNAKHIYKKLGFNKISEKTTLFFNLEEK